MSSSNQYNALGSEIRVAAKKLRCHDTTMDGDTFSKALAYELDLLVDLSHPNIGKLTGFEQDLQNGIVWMFSTWEANGNLSEFLATGQWKIPERLSLVKDIIAGLKYLHTYQPPICHGNFKSIITNKIPLSGNDSSTLETFERNLPEIHGATEREQVSSLCGLVEACLALDPLKRPTIEWCETEVKGMASVVPASGTLSGDKIRSPKLLCELGRTHYQLGNNEAALPLFTQALAIARIVGDNSLVAEAMVGLGNIQRDLGKYAAAEESFSGARNIYVRNDNHLGQAAVLSGLGEVCRFQAKYVEAESFFKSALDIYTRFDDDLGLGTTLRGLAHIYRIQSKHQEAEETFIRARESYTRIGDDLGRADTLGGLGDIYRVQAMFQQAEECFIKAQDIYTRMDNALGRADMFRGLGNAYRAQARYSSAEECFKQSRNLYFHIGNERGQAGALRGLGNVYRAQSKYSEAEEALTEARDLSTRIGDDSGLAAAFRGLGNVYRAQARYGEAKSSFILARDLSALIEDDQGQADALGGLGDAYRGEGSYEEAEDALNDAYEIYTRMCDKRGQADTLAGLGSIYDAQSMYGEAAELFVQARDLYCAIDNDVGEADMLGLLGEMYLFQDMYTEAEESFGHAREIYTRLGNHRGRGNASRGLDRVACARQDQLQVEACDDDSSDADVQTTRNLSDGESNGVAEGSSSDPLDLEPLIGSVSSTPVNVNGHFCDVFQGIHNTAGKVALKRPRIAGTDYDGDAIRRFEREAATWKHLRHPHILEFIGTLKRDGHLYLVSPFIANGTLVEYLFRHPDVKRVRLLRETADAIQYLHRQNVIHGDIKGTNILISEDAHVLLCDFGLTKMIDSRTSTCAKGAGSVRWMSPELWDNEPRTFESDVYAFGMTIAEVLTGQAPFPHLLTSTGVMMAVMGRNERPLRDPASSPDGESYEEAWKVAAACWPTSPSERISIAEAHHRLLTEHVASW
ncbi:hypothetical protein FRC05_010538 [Tulasnella sp. 425]|nr:hypothetical protein FRC05_010538 [Tulasnella sp. 425]